LIACSAAGLVIFLMARALGEFALYNPVAGSFSTYAHELLGRQTGFITGWSYWLMRILVSTAEITGIGVLMRASGDKPGHAPRVLFSRRLVRPAVGCGCLRSGRGAAVARKCWAPLSAEHCKQARRAHSTADTHAHHDVFGAASPAFDQRMSR
jgi:amino acid transporter